MQLRFLILFILSFYSSLAQDQVSFYFQSDKFELENDQLLKFNKWVETNKESKIISIVGMTDEKGANDYNNVLSSKRVDFILKKINNQIKLREDFISLSLGETALTTNKDSENRKVTIYFLDKKKLHLEEYLLNDVIVLKKIEALKIIDVEKLNFPPKLDLDNIVKKTPIGTLFTLEDLQFQFDSAELIRTTKIELDNWVKVLNDNPQIKIIIQGHICCIPKDDIFLSSQRAKSVLDYFISKGISEERMNYIGFGSSRPKFKIPEKNGYEALINRRVEIVIIEK